VRCWAWRCRLASDGCTATPIFGWRVEQDLDVFTRSALSKPPLFVPPVYVGCWDRLGGDYRLRFLADVDIHERRLHRRSVHVPVAEWLRSVKARDVITNTWECSRKRIPEVQHHFPPDGTAQRTPSGQQGERNGRNKIILGMCSSPSHRNLTSPFTQIWELPCSRQSQVQKVPFHVLQTVAIPPPVAAIWAGLKLSRGCYPLVRGRR
jgi:hypothetical protein